ncbi:MAG: DUF4442 domain-containing protein, partial [Leptospiraceae bacterium]|nr:DUF4442 domain-containing protein [Leptospiraceae bacterium]
MASKKGLDFSIHPLWNFLEEKFGMQEAFNLFSPYKGANIHPRIVDNFTYEVEMPLILSNTNYVGAHFGGSLYAMCDPFFMFLLMNNLGKNYIVWDKSACIDFLKPGKGTVKAIFHIPQSEIDYIIDYLKDKKKTTRF